MSLSNTSRSYGSLAKSFHWLTALLILTAIPLGIVAYKLSQRIVDPSIATTDADIARVALLFSLHKTIGVTVFFVALARIGWALANPKPGLLNGDKRLEAFAAETVHWLLYGALVLVPLTGWIHHAAAEGYAPIWWPFGQNLPFIPKDAALSALFGTVHKTLQPVLFAAIFLHVAGAVKHHVIDRDLTLRRMLPGQVDAPTPPAADHSRAPILAALVVWLAALGVGIATADRSAAPGTAPDLAEVDSDWVVDSGTLAITVTQLGSPVSGSFGDWTAAIVFDDPAAPGPAGSVEVTVAIGSLELGSVTAQAMGADFFDQAQFPTATFAAEIVKTDSGYQAAGPLTIKGASIPVVLPFTLAVDGDRAEMSGTLQLDRQDFGIGASMADESSLGFAVDVTVDLVATRG
ncbi:MAG: cytochrome b/b6 domain-containing protein [Marinibacterium sp.]|nr:cytochrome b/b6 domain-containing protein [Marinibacterium sp.]